jgi:hypothetical protein
MECHVPDSVVADLVSIQLVSPASGDATHKLLWAAKKDLDELSFHSISFPASGDDLNSRKRKNIEFPFN